MIQITGMIHILGWGILSLLPVLASGQSLNDEERINVTFSALSWEKPLGETLYVRPANGDPIPLTTHHVKRSESIDYFGPNPIVFYRKLNGNPEPRYQPVASIEIDPNLIRPLLLFTETPNELRVISMEDSFESFPTGSYRFFNLTDKDLVAKFGEEVMQLKPRKTAILNQPFDDTTDYHVLFVVRDSDGVKPLYSNRWRHNENFRYVVIVSESGSGKTGPVQFRLLSDFPQK